MTKRREAFMPLFFGDLLASTPEWSGEEQSLYLTLLAYQWTIGSLPIEAEKVRRVVKWERKSFDAAWPTVSAKFPEVDERRLNPRLEDHRAHSHKVSEKRATSGAAGAAKRHGKQVAIATDLPDQTGGNSLANAKVLLCHQSNQSNSVDKSTGAEAPPVPDSPDPADPRKQLFDLGKSILGRNSGGLISQAISRTNEAKVGQVLGEMAVKPMADPKAYFAAATTPKERGVVF